MVRGFGAERADTTGGNGTLVSGIAEGKQTSVGGHHPVPKVVRRRGDPGYLSL